MKSRILILSLILVLAALPLVACAKPTPAPAPAPAPAPKPAPAPAPAPKPEKLSPEEFYKKNQVTIIADSSPGGGTDFIARLFASYWTEFTEGPAMPVRVMSGKGGVRGSEYVFNAEPDGLTIGNTHHPRTMILGPVLGLPGPEFDRSKLGYIGFMGAAPYFFAIAENLPYTTVDELKHGEEQILLGAKVVGGSTFLGSVVASEVLGLDAKIVAGYEIREIALAAARGEIHGQGSEAQTILPDIENGLTKPIAVLAYQRHSDWFDVPAVPEIVDKLTPAQEDILAFLDAAKAGKTFFVPPGTPPDRLEYLRHIFTEIMSYKPFLKLASKRWPVWVEPLTGEEIEQEILRVLNMPAERTEALRKVLMEKYVK